MKILLIEPPFSRLIKWNDIFFPLGLGYLASYLSKHGYKVRIYNSEIPQTPFKYDDNKKGKYQKLLSEHNNYKEALQNDNHEVWKEIRNVINSYQPDMVGITVRSAKFPSALKVASIAKSINRECLVVLGGPHPTICPEQSILANNIDFIVRGEGESTILELCQTIEGDSTSDLTHIKGLSFKRNGEAIHNGARELIKDLDVIPFPGRDLVLNPDLYSSKNMAVIVTGRGCPFDCGYCSAQSIWTNKVRYRSIENTINEIKHIKNRFSADSIYFWDDSFTVNKRRVIDLCNIIINDKIDIRWGCTSRVDLLDDELLTIMKSAGCEKIDIGIESGSERILKLINKRITVQKVKQSIELIRGHNIKIGAFFMIGFPEETKQDINCTLDLIKKSKVDSICLSIFTPYPATKLYDKAMSLGLIPKKIDWENFNHHSPDNFFSKHINKKEHIKIISEATLLVDNYNKKRQPNNLISRIIFYIKNPKLFFSKLQEKIQNRLSYHS
jgi:anaerobic magnesium-protoporphyrin IX monomethyl ester cyclase